MKVTVEQIDRQREEELIVRCHDPGAAWVESVREAASSQRTVCCWREDTLHRLKLSEVFYFEVVDDRSFIYTQAEVFEAKEKLYSQTESPYCQTGRSSRLQIKRKIPCFPAAGIHS